MHAFIYVIRSLNFIVSFQHWSGITYTYIDLKTFKAQTFLNLPIVNKWRRIYCCEQWNIPTSKRSKKTQTQSQTQNVLALNLIIYGKIFTTKAKIVTNQRSDDETWPKRWCYLILSCWTINLLIFRFVLVRMISIQQNRPLILSHSIHQLFYIMCVCLCVKNKCWGGDKHEFLTVELLNEKILICRWNAIIRAIGFLMLWPIFWQRAAVFFLLSL